MTSEDYISNLLKVSELKKEIKNKFTKQTLQDQGLKQDLTQFHQPVTESQTKIKDSLITHLSNLSAESNKKMDTYIDQVKSLLDTKEIEKEEPETVVKAEEISDYDHLLLLAGAKRTEDIKYWLAEKNNLDYLIRFVQKNHDINFRTNPWRQIKLADPELYIQIKSAKTAKKGTGVKFLPSGKQELIHELFRLIGSYKSGNKNVYNELNAVVDQLRRNGTLSVEHSKKIYKTIS